jgi:hypothetical protein
VIQKIKGKEADESGDEGDGDHGEQLWEDDDFRKKNVEGSLRSYVLTEQCRRMVTDEYFGTPVRNVEGMANIESSVHTLTRHSTDDESPSILCPML